MGIALNLCSGSSKQIIVPNNKLIIGNDMNNKYNKDINGVKLKSNNNNKVEEKKKKKKFKQAINYFKNMKEISNNVIQNDVYNKGLKLAKVAYINSFSNELTT